MSATKKNEAAAQEEQKILLPPPKAEEPEIKNPYISFYRIYEEVVDILGKEEAGKVLKGIVAHGTDKPEPGDLSRLAKTFLELIKIIIDKDDLIWIYEKDREHQQQKERKATE